MGSGISEAMGSIGSIKDVLGDAPSKMPDGMMGALTPGTMSGAASSAPSALSQFGKKALKNGLMGGAQGLQQQGQGQQRGGGVMPQYIQGAMLPQIPGQSQQQVTPYGVNNPFFGG